MKKRVEYVPQFKHEGHGENWAWLCGGLSKPECLEIINRHLRVCASKTCETRILKRTTIDEVVK